MNRLHKFEKQFLHCDGEETESLLDEQITTAEGGTEYF
jgi:hypothetical protein